MYVYSHSNRVALLFHATHTQTYRRPCSLRWRELSDQLWRVRPGICLVHRIGVRTGPSTRHSKAIATRHRCRMRLTQRTHRWQLRRYVKMTKQKRQETSKWKKSEKSLPQIHFDRNNNNGSRENDVLLIRQRIELIDSVHFRLMEILNVCLKIEFHWTATARNEL